MNESHKEEITIKFYICIFFKVHKAFFFHMISFNSHKTPELSLENMKNKQRKYDLTFIDEKTGSERLSNLPKLYSTYSKLYQVHAQCNSTI